MANFVPKLWVIPFATMSIFRLFELLVFMAQTGVFSFQNILKDIFLAYIAQKQKVGKMANFGPKVWVNLFGKMSVFPLFQLFVFIGYKGVFSKQNIVKKNFGGLCFLKNKSWKNGHLQTKTWVNPFGKMSIFRLFELLVLVAQKGVFSFQNIEKHILLAYIA